MESRIPFFDGMGKQKSKLKVGILIPFSRIVGRHLGHEKEKHQSRRAPFSSALDSNVLGNFYIEIFRGFAYSVQIIPSSNRYPCLCWGVLTCFRANYC